MSVSLRLTGEAREVAAVLAVVATQLDLYYDGRTYPSRGGLTVRAYADVSAPHLDRSSTVRARALVSDRADRGRGR